MSESTSSRGKEILAGSFFLFTSLAFFLLGKNLELGSLRSMGPGFFPMIVTGILALLGMITIAAGLRADKGTGKIDLASLRPLACIFASPALFAILMEPFGLAPSLILSVWLATAGGKPWKPVKSLLLSVVVTAFCYLVFVIALGMPIPLFSWPGR